jgi:hypothetical protein
VKENPIDRTDWSAGPWDDEPDREQWTTEVGLPGLLVRNRMGALCGYAAVNPGHPFHGIDYAACGRRHGPRCQRSPRSEYPVPISDEWWERVKDDTHCEHTPEAVLEVHGGITYADACAEDGPICHVPAPGEPDDVWWFGFDCGHAFDLAPGMVAHYRTLPGLAGSSPLFDGTYRDVAYVRAEVEGLAHQLRAWEHS